MSGYVEEFQITFGVLVLGGWGCLLHFSRSPAATKELKWLGKFYVCTICALARSLAHVNTRFKAHNHNSLPMLLAIAF